MERRRSPVMFLVGFAGGALAAAVVLAVFGGAVMLANRAFGWSLAVIELRGALCLIAVAGVSGGFAAMSGMFGD